MLEPTSQLTESQHAESTRPQGDGPRPRGPVESSAQEDSLLSRLFGVRRGDGTTVPGDGGRGLGTVALDRARPRDHAPDALREEMGERVSSGFRDLSRLLVAIKETLQNRDGQVQQTLQALPAYLQQVPRIQRAQIDCMAQISKQLEHMGTGTRDVLARLETVPDLLRALAEHQASQAHYLDQIQQRTTEALDQQSSAIREGLETSRRQAETQLGMIRSIAGTQEDVFSTFQNTQNRALNVFHRAQQQANAQHRETQRVLSKQVEMLVQKVHTAQSRVFWLSIGFALLAAGGFVAALLLAG